MTLDKRKHVLAAGAVCAAALAAFAVLAILVAGGNAAWLDDPIRNGFYALRSPGLTTLMEAITYLGNWQTVTVVCLLLLAFDQTRIPYGLAGSAVALTDTLINKGLKALFERARPEDVTALIDQGGYAFPSGHSVTSIAFYGILLYLVRTRMENRRNANALTVLLVLLMVLIGPSRIYLGVHFPTDVLAGWAEGLFIAGAAVMLLHLLPVWRRPERPLEENK